MYDLQLVNVGAGLGSATTTLLQEGSKARRYLSYWHGRLKMLDFEAQRQALGLECEADDACFAEIAVRLGGR